MPAGEPLHVTHGDITAAGLREAGIAERALRWQDALHEGPVPAVPAAELRRIRARVLASDGADAVERMLAERDATLDANRGGAYVLWFEADLYDQLQIAQILTRLAELEVEPERITLINIGEHMGIARFGGLGELRPDQLRELPATSAVALDQDALRLAAEAWAALRAPDPSGLAPVAASRSPLLRFLGEAFERLCREYPSTRDGLSLTERRLLAAAGQAGTAGGAFVRYAAREPRPFLGDTWAFQALERLAGARVPLLEAAAPVGRETAVALTAAGREVVAGAADHVALNGIDRWIGGVHLHGECAAWRWDEGTEALVAAQQTGLSSY
jgi:hypothetical protein